MLPPGEERRTAHRRHFLLTAGSSHNTRINHRALYQLGQSREQNRQWRASSIRLSTLLAKDSVHNKTGCVCPWLCASCCCCFRLVLTPTCLQRGTGGSARFPLLGAFSSSVSWREVPLRSDFGNFAKPRRFRRLRYFASPVFAKLFSEVA